MSDTKGGNKCSALILKDKIVIRKPTASRVDEDINPEFRI